MISHALEVLEFPRVLDLVAARAASPLGAARVRALHPLFDRESIARELARVTAMRATMQSDAGWESEPIPELESPLARLRVAGSAWSGQELRAGLTLLASSRRTHAALGDPRRPAAALGVLASFRDRLLVAERQEASLARGIDNAGDVRDDASPELRRLRRELRASQGRLVALLERIVSRLDSHHAVPDMSVTVRNGRYVIPVRREGRGVVGGIVHDTSSTGATLFIEPPAAVEFGNRVRELEADEAREVERVLLELTAEIRPLHGEMARALDALVALDSLQARARFAIDLDCAPVELCSPGEGFTIVQGRHPLLLVRGVPVVAFDLALVSPERTLLISGPNTGGKTVLLKAVGLLAAMTQAGIPVPVSLGSRIATFDSFYADIGDEQSIDASLSTFSAHLRNLAEILRSATRESLVLADELGSGTDPDEGAALGGAILETLTARGTLTLATTHLGVLKQLAGEVTGVVNASLQFDAARLAPTYRLIKGIPGRSYGLGIARRLQLPDAVLARAEERLPQGERDVAVLLAELEVREAALADREREAQEMAGEARSRAHTLAQRERTIADRERAAERASRSDARRHLLEARGEIERTIRELRARGAAQLDEAARAARRAAELLIAQQTDALAELDPAEPNHTGGAVGAGVDPRADAGAHAEDASADAALAPGDMVEVDTLGGRAGLLVGVRDGDGLVAVGAMKLTVPLASLRRSATSAREPERSTPLFGDIPDVQASSEIDVRGMRADEVDAPVVQAIDAAVRADLRSLRIIHGKGTGSLRERVAEMLRKDVRVKEFRLGAWNEGGAGVTIADLG